MLSSLNAESRSCRGQESTVRGQHEYSYRLITGQSVQLVVSTSTVKGQH